MIVEKMLFYFNISAKIINTLCYEKNIFFLAIDTLMVFIGVSLWSSTRAVNSGSHRLRLI
ncbi:MAG: hypothetical protein A2275_04745 [Bacteroidetes bacterium RIFOXYA12_FULL_35_11]|nr:MAG: hypothetical protein A2275_04745 [Bacteroidetes bacterium RIFOXYA12_FULL_35_11]OFZ00091.1 MAG: hypothetical protein A2491_19300 [Bacteroidetes bacterium RIFOXYC12_FULL_35_7]